MYVNGNQGDAIESGPAALPADPDHLPGPNLPFPGTIGPEHAVAHRGWRDACDRALAAVLSGPGLVLVLGSPGTGKTLLLQHLARVLRASGTDVLLFTRGDLDIADNEIAGSKIAGRRAVLIDEADRLSAESVERLGRLGRCAFVLAGVTEPGEDFKPAASEGTTIVRLAALAPDEVGAFVTARLVQAGLRPDLLTEQAIERLGALTGGLPRVLNMVTGSALFLARAAQASRVDAAHVIEAAALRECPPDLDLQRPAEPNRPADPSSSDTHPVHPPSVAKSGTPLRVPAVTLTGALPSRGEQTRRPSRVASAGLLATALLAAACAWLLVRPGQRPPAVRPPEAALVLASPTRPPVLASPPRPPLPIVQPERAPGPVGTLAGSPSASSTPSAATPLAAAAHGVGTPVTDQGAGLRESGVGTSGPEPGASGRTAPVISAPVRPNDTSVGSGLAETRPRARHRSDQPRTWRGRSHPEASASRSGILGRLGERAPVESTRQNDGSPPGIAIAPPQPATIGPRTPNYIGIYTTGPDGIRTFRASP